MAKALADVWDYALGRCVNEDCEQQFLLIDYDDHIPEECPDCPGHRLVVRAIDETAYGIFLARGIEEL